jgi:superfamily II DNA or RNA helicase
MEQARTPVNPAQPKTILILSNRLILQDAPGNLVDEIRKRLTFDNPAYLENEKMGRWNGNTPATIRLYERSESSLIVPRGFIPQTIALIRQYNVRFQFEDRRQTLPPVDFTFKGELRPFQLEAVKAVLKKHFGTLVAPTGSGKTVMALAVIAGREQSALIIVHTRELLDQWVSRIESFLGIPKQQIGVIGGGKNRIGEKVTVALVQSLYKCASDVAPSIGFLIIDECHHAPSRTFTEAVTAFDSKYMLGLTATAWRRDRLSQFIFRYVGDVVHEIEKSGLIENGNVLPFEVVTKETSFQSSYDPSEEYTKMLSELCEDNERNRLIADTVKTNSRGRGISLVLTDRKEHCRRLRTLLETRGIRAEILTGDLSTGERREIVDRMSRGKIKTVIATGQLLGEGFDCPALTTLFIATPIKFDGRLVQYLGRVLRPAPGKDKAVVFDFVDSRVGVLRASASARQRVYQGQMERAS